MYLSDTFAMLKRHWVLALLGIVFTIILGAIAYVVVAPQYQSTANVVLLPPKLTAEQGANPFLVLGGLRTTSDVIARAMGTDEIKRDVVAAGGSDSYVIESDPTTNGPLLLITANGGTPQQVQQTLQLLIDEVPQVLKEVQEANGIKPSFRISSSVIAQQREPSATRSSQIRAVVAAVLMGAILSLGLISLVDARERRKVLLAHAADQPHSTEDPDMTSDASSPPLSVAQS